MSLLVARLLVVGADEDLAAGDDRAAVGLGAEVGDPLDVLVLPCLDVPLGGQVLGVEVDHVACGRAAVHGPVGLGGLTGFRVRIHGPRGHLRATK